MSDTGRTPAGPAVTRLASYSVLALELATGRLELKLEFRLELRLEARARLSLSSARATSARRRVRLAVPIG
jgi:hypothetical protein